MTYEEAVEAVKDKLFELVCMGGGDGDTLADFAEQITDLFVDKELEI